MKTYLDHPTLRQMLLEDSYVLDVEVHPGTLLIRMDFVLTPEHPEYRLPKDDEAECFRRGELGFGGLRHLEWNDPGTPPSVDATGELDYGNIDRFEWTDTGDYLIEGDLGRMEIMARSLELLLV